MREGTAAQLSSAMVNMRDVHLKIGELTDVMAEKCRELGEAFAALGEQAALLYHHGVHCSTTCPHIMEPCSL